MRIVETKVYKIDEHPNREKCFDWIRENWNDLNQHSVDEIIESIKALSKEIGGTNDYSICQSPDQGEFISFSNYSKNHLMTLKPGTLPLTGICWDYDVIEGLQKEYPGQVLESLHNDTRYTYSDEGLFEICEVNEYEFEENGFLHS